MTNEEKYKTPETRRMAFLMFCSKNFCGPCRANGSASVRDKCVLNWLALEAEEEEKPRSCPFCGGEAEVAETHPLSTKRVYVRCKECGASITALNTEFDAITAWNKRAGVAV